MLVYIAQAKAAGPHCSFIPAREVYLEKHPFLSGLIDFNGALKFHLKGAFMFFILAVLEHSTAHRLPYKRDSHTIVIDL